MPELPEVESIKIQLNKFIVGHIIKNVEVKYEKCFKGDQKLLIGAKIVNVRRFGKALVIDMSNGYSIVVHVKMTGQLIYRGVNLKDQVKISEKVKGGLSGKHNHVIFILDRDSKLFYVDYRKFGWIKVFKTKDVETIDFVGSLGPEPKLDGIEQHQDTLSLTEFKELLLRSARPIKLTIMDQKKISGIGNIYANDALFLAKINPRRSAKDLDSYETEKLYKSLQKVLSNGIKFGGASELAFVTPDGEEGKYQTHTLVYGKDGEACQKKCGGEIEKFKLGGRGTYWCPECQK